MKTVCLSCNGTGCGPMGQYSPRHPVCLDCNGTGEIERCAVCGKQVDDGECECETKKENRVGQSRGDGAGMNAEEILKMRDDLKSEIRRLLVEFSTGEFAKTEGELEDKIRSLLAEFSAKTGMKDVGVKIQSSSWIGEDYVMDVKVTR